MGTIATGGATLPITIASFGRHLEAYSDGTNWVIMRSSGDTASITASTLGLGNVANTSPSGLPISNAVSSAMTLKANLSGANFSGNITAPTINAITSLLVGGTNLSDIYLRTNNFNSTVSNYLLTNHFNSTVSNYLLTKHFNSTVSKYLLTNHFNSTVSNYLKTVDYNITHTNIISSLNSTTSSLLTISNFNSTFNSLINTTINQYLRTSMFNTTNQSNIDNLNTLNSMIYSDAGDVSINCNNNVNFKAVVNSQLRIPLSVNPSQIVVESTTNPSCIINSPTVANSTISFRNGANYCCSGMAGGNCLMNY